MSRHNHVIDEANIISKIFFFWTHSFLWKGYYGKLSARDINTTPKDCDCNHIVSNFKRGLKKYTKIKVTALTLIKTLYHLNSREMIVSFGLCALQEWILKPVAPVMLGLLLHQMSAPTADSLKELQFVLIISLMYILQEFTFQHACYLGKKCSIRAQHAITSIIYEKAMNLTLENYSETNAGRIVNFVTNDINQFDTTYITVYYIITSPVQIIIVGIILWHGMGPYSVIGLTVFLFFILMQASVGKALTKLSTLKLKATDKRLKIMNDILAGIKMIKMYGWENRFFKKLSAERKDECRTLNRMTLLKSINLAMIHSSIKLLGLITLLFYLFGDKGTLKAEKVFPMIFLFYSIRISLPLLFLQGLSGMALVYSSLVRISEFLNLEENTQSGIEKEVVRNPRVSVVNAYASWSKKESVLKNINFNLQNNDFVTIIGPTGSGKTSLLMLILRELRLVKGSINVHGSIAYVPQESWVFSDTVITNITLGNEANYENINRIIDYCALRPDVESFPNDTETLVGERGIKLSGGQRARLSLARALYKNADIYLLDDPLSAVDPEVGNRIYNQCIKEYLNNKLRILVTHQIQHIRNDQKVILMNKGCIQASGTFEEVMKYVYKWNIDLNRHDVDDVNSPKTEILQKRQISEPNRKVDDERGEESKTDGYVPWKIYWNFFRNGGNTFFILMIAFLALASSAFNNGSDYWLKIWVENANKLGSLHENENHGKKITESTSKNWNSSSDCLKFTSFFSNATCSSSQAYFLDVFVLLVFLNILFITLSCVYNSTICMRSTRKLHDTMFDRMLHVPMYFFNMNPIGRILNRFAKDVGNVDDQLPHVFRNFVAMVAFSIVSMVIICIQSYYLVIPLVLMVLLFFPISYLYFSTCQTLKRIDNSTKSPILSHVSTSLDGRISIRAFNSVQEFKKNLTKLQNTNIASSVIFNGVEAWFLFAGSLLGTVFACVATILPVFLTESNRSGTVGFIFTQVVQAGAASHLVLRVFAELQSQFTSVERIMEYGDLSPEASKVSSPDKKPVSSWPNTGEIKFKDVSLRYKSTEPYILKSLNFQIKSKEKIGIVGRTGAGKTSMINALFRLVEPEGTIEIDGVIVNDIGLHDLRHRLSVIPQEPLIFADTIRYNLDPFNELDDYDLWDVLTDVELASVVGAFPHKLNTMLGSETNLSFGQSQLVCLARAILKRNKILILDEATSNVDQSTDTLIQKTIRSKFKECTVITIAHRLNTVLDSDRIMVIDGGRIVEFDSPSVLAKDKRSKFCKIIQDSGPGVETLLQKTSL